MLTRSRNSLVLSAAVAAAFLAIGHANAATITWTNVGADFATAANWSGGTPSAANDAVLANTYGGVTNSPSLGASASLNSALFSSALSPSLGYTVTNSSGSNVVTIGGAGAAANLITRGYGTTTFNGPTIAGASVSNTVNIDVGFGTTLVLQGDSKVTANQGNTNINGGVLKLDNTAVNATDRFTTGGVIKLQGSGTFELIGNSAGGTYNVGSLNTADNSDGGVNTIKVTPNTIAANTVLNFANTGTFTIRQGTRNVTVFEATTGELGATNGPHITFTGTPFTGSGGLFSNTAGATTVGFVIVKDSLGTNFATYSTTAGVGVVSLASSAAKPATAVITTVTTAAGLSGLTAAATSSVGSNGQFNAPASTITMTANSAAASLRISPAGAGGILDANTRNLLWAGVMLDGAFDYAITGTGTPFSGTHYFYINNPNTTLSYQPVLTTSGNQVLIAGPGFMDLTGSVSQNLAGTARINIAGGVLRANNTQLGFGLASPGTLTFGGGVLEIKNGANGTGASADFVRALGTAGTGNVNWGGNTSAEQGSGGFSAFGAPASVNIGGSASPAAMRWHLTNFVGDGFALKFGSAKSNAVLTFLNPLQLDSTATTYQVREVSVTAGAGGDKTILAGVVSGASYADLLKTGTGTLELNQANTYAGNTLIQNGTLKLATASATNIASSPRIMVGLLSGSSAVLDVTGVTNGAGFEVQSGQTLGGHGTVLTTDVPTTITAGATIAPGASIGTLAINGGSLILAGSSSFEITGDATANTYDKIVGINDPTLTYGGTLNVSFLTTDPTNAGTYTLFSGFTVNPNTFGAVNLPAAPSGLQWHDYGSGVYFDYDNGEIQLEAAASSIDVVVTPGSGNLGPAAPAVSIAITGGSATLGSFATSGLGWSTNGLTAGSFSTTQELNTVSNQSGRLNGTFRGRTSFAVSDADSGNGTYSYALSDSAAGQSVLPGAGTTFGAAQTSTLVSGDKLAGQNSVEGAGGLGKVATLVDSTALPGDSDVALKWRNRSSFEAYPGSAPPLPTNISSLITDVVNIDLGANAPTTYVIEMSYNPAGLGGVGELESYNAGHLYLAHMTPEFFDLIDTGNGGLEDRWQNATLDSGNPLNDGFLRGYLTSDLSTIGSWGVDTINHVAWAVMPSGVQGQFAVVPEPASLSLLMFGALGLLRRRR